MGFKLSDDAPVTSFRLSSALEDPAEAPAPAHTAQRMSSALESIGPEKTDKPGSWRYPSDGPRVWQEDAPEEVAAPIADEDVVQPGKTEPSRGRASLERQLMPEIEVSATREQPKAERPKKLIKEGHYEKRYMRGEPVDIWIPAQYDDGTASFGEAMSEVPHQVIARGDKMVEGAKHMVAADRASGARKRVWQATVLPQAYKEWQEYNNSRIDERERKNLDEMPSVIRGAELAGVRPDQFARDWPDFVNKKPEDLSKDRQADLALFNEQKAKRDKARKGIKLANQLASDYRPEMDEWSPTAIAFDALSSLPDLAAGVGVTAATGSPGAGLGFLFATTAPVAYADAIEGGASEGKAQLYAMLYGLAEVAPETPVMDLLAKTSAGKRTMAKILGKWGDSAGVRVATAAGFEGASESLTQALQLAIDSGVINKDTPLNEALEQIARAGVTGSVMGGTIGAVGEGGSAIRERQARKKTPPQPKPSDAGPSLSTTEAEAAEEPEKPEDYLQLDKIKATAKQYATPEEMAAAEALPETEQLLKLQEYLDRGTDYSRPPEKPEEPAKETKARVDQDAVYENTEDQDVQQAAKVAKPLAKPEEIEAALALPTAKERLAALQPLVDRGVSFLSEKPDVSADMPPEATERRAAERGPGTGTELAQPGQSTPSPDVEALKAVREGKASPEQVAQLEQKKLVIRSETNVPRLLPAGRRELAKAEGHVVETKVHGQEISVNVRPSDAQKEAGNYEKGSVKLFGMDLAIENPAGSERAWSNPDTGESGSRKMKYPYGYVKRTEGADGDAVDVFIGPNDKSKKVYVINQMKGDGSGKFDEHKAMLGFNNPEHAKAGYLRHYQKGWKGMGEVVEMTTEEFREWAKSGDTTKPIANAPERRVQFSQSEDGMSKILAPRGETGMAGEETGKHVADGISKYKSKNGSYRYVYSEGGEALSALQVVSKDGVEGLAANVYTLPKHRRKGLATKLYDAARKDFQQLKHNEHQTEDGKKLVASMAKKKPRVQFAKSEERMRIDIEAKDFAEKLKEELGLERFDVYLDSSNYMHLAMLEVPRGKRKQGIGTRAMERLIAWSDKTNIPLSLTLADRDPETGTTSKARLRRFYGRFGFVNNRGRHKDFSTRASMIRKPKRGITVYRAGGKRGMTHRSGGPTFYSTERKGSVPYANGKPSVIRAETINPRAIFDTRNLEHRALYNRFLKEGNHPFGHGRTGRPFWTAEPDLKAWLDSQGYNFDAIMFDENTDIPSIAMYGQQKLQYAKTSRTGAFRKWFGKSKVVDENGKPKVVYHGAGRADRFGPVLRKDRATSGPMPFFTEDPAIASSYATGKQDNSMEDYGYETWFTVEIDGNPVNIDKLWWKLTRAERAEIAKRATHVFKNDDGEVVYDENEKDGVGGYDFQVERERGDHIKALIDRWLLGGTLFNEEIQFLEVLKLAGLKRRVMFTDQQELQSGVMPAFLSIQNPLDTGKIPKKVIAALEEAAEAQPSKPPAEYGADLWDKNTISADDWMAQLREDLANDARLVWTRVPDWVTATLKELGYDGIKDTGGKYQKHTEHAVWVPFEPGQVKSAIGNQGTFDPNSPDVLKSVTPFFSAVERVVEKSSQKSATPAQWKALLTNSQGIKTDELKWMGVIEWLDNYGEGFDLGGKVTKDQLMAFIQANKLEVIETTLGGPTKTKQNEFKQKINQLTVELTALGYTPEFEESEFDEQLLMGARGRDGTMYVHMDDGTWEGVRRGQSYALENKEVLRKLAELGEAVKGLNVNGLEGEGQPQYTNWQTPGGKNYHELLIQLPHVPSTENWTVKAGARDPASGPVWEVRDARGRWVLGIPQENGRVSEEEALQRAASSERGPTPLYNAPHFAGHANILVHTRFNEREDDEGRRILFIEEIQSDWHQQGRKRGYQGNADDQLHQKRAAAENRVEDTKKAAKEALERNDMLGFDSYVIAMSAIRQHADWATRWDVNPEDVPAIQANAAAREELRVINQELRNRGGQPPDAPFKTTWHELAFKRMVRWAAEQGFERIAWTTGKMQAERYNLGQHVSEIQIWKEDETTAPYRMEALNLDGHVAFVESQIPFSRLQELAGDEIAAKAQALESGGKSLIVKGDELRVGGSGMSGFYDRILVNYANKLGKKFDSSVSKTTITIEDPKLDADGDVIVNHTHEVHVLEVTPEMAESAMGGQPLFSRGPTGRGMDAQDLRAEIAQLTRGYRTPPIEVYQGLNNMPPHLVRRLRADGGDASAVDAFFDGEKIVLIADHIMGPAHLADTVYHELVVHYGLRQSMDQDALEEIQDGVWRDMQKAVRDVAKRNGLDVEDLEQRRLAAEEVIAYMAGKVVQGKKLDPVERTTWEAVKAAILRVLDRLGLRRYYDETRIAKIILEANANLKVNPSLVSDRLQHPALMRSTKAPLWYSPMLREFEDPKLQNVATPDEWLKIISNKISTGKIREAEMKWYDLREWIKTLGVSQALKQFPKAFTAKDMPKGYEQNFQEHLKFQKWFEDVNSPLADTAEGKAALVSRAIELMGGTDAIPPFSEVKYILDAPEPSKFPEALRWMPTYYHGLVATFGDDPVARIPKSIIQEKLRKDQLTFLVRYPTPTDVEANNSIDWDDPDGTVNFDEDYARESAEENLDDYEVNKKALDLLEEDWDDVDYEFEEKDFISSSDYHKWKDGIPDGVKPSEDLPDTAVIKDEVLVEIAKQNGQWDKAKEQWIEERVESDRIFEHEQGQYSWSGTWKDGAGHEFEFNAWGPVQGGRDWSIVVDGVNIEGESKDRDRHFDSRQAIKKIREYIMQKADMTGENAPFDPQYQQYTLPVDKTLYKEKLLVWTNREASGRGEGKLLVPGFEHGHFSDDRDFIAHMRSYVTTTTDGKKILVMDELQSDWHQEIRDASQGIEAEREAQIRARKRFDELKGKYIIDNYARKATDFLRENTFKKLELLSAEAPGSQNLQEFLTDAVSQLIPNQDDWQPLFDKIAGKTTKRMSGVDEGVSGEDAMRLAGIHPEDSLARREYWAGITEAERRKLIKNYRVAHGAIAHEDEVLEVIKKLGGTQGLTDYVFKTDMERQKHWTYGEIPYALTVFDKLKTVSDFDIRSQDFNELNTMNLEMYEAKRAIDKVPGGDIIVPPLDRTWPIALFQWAVREAAEKNLDGIALAPGSVHGTRWGATKSIESVMVDILGEEDSGEYANEPLVDEAVADQWENGGQTKEDPFYVLARPGSNDRIVTKRSRLAGWIGKRAATELLEKLSEPTGQLTLGIPPKTRATVYSRNDMTIWWPSRVGHARDARIHHGSMEIYNSIVPNQLNDWLKKWKVKFGAAEFALGQSVRDGDAALVGVQGTASDEDLETQAKAWRRFEMPTVMLTPEIKKESLEKGFPLLFSRKWYQRAKNVANRVVQGGTNFDLPDPTSRSRAWNWLVYKVQDKFVDLFKTQQEAAAWHQVAQIPDQMDAYLQQTLFHGRAEDGIKEHEKQFVEPLIKQIKDSGYSWEDVEDFLYARHAPEANAHLLTINGGNPAFNSGMTDQEAQQTMAQLAAAGDIRKLHAIGAAVDLMTKWSRDQMVMNGLEDASTIQTWENTYKHYVPLKGWKDQVGDPDVADFFGMPKKGKGFDTGGKLTKMRTGRSSRAATILANVVAQAQATVILSEKAKVGRALYDFVKATPSSRLWSVDEVEYMKFVDPNTGLVRQGVNPTYQLADNVIRVKVGGKDFHITFNPAIPQMQRIAASMKNLSADQIGPILAALHRVNRFLSAVNTSLNPEFTVTNALRDIQTALVNLNEVDIDGIKRSILGDWRKAWWAIRRGEQKSTWIAKNHTAQWAQEWAEFKKQGAKVGWLDHYKSPVELDQKLQRMMGPDGVIGWSAHGIRRLGDFVENENLAVENALRLSTYVNLRNAGLSQQRAAEYAKNLTVNFNRKGEAGTVINSVYLFFNAAIQGTARMIMSMKNKKVRRVMYGIVAAAMAREILNQLLSPLDDDDEPLYDKIPDGEKERNMIFMLPQSADAAIKSVLPSWMEPSDRISYVKIPLPYGYNVLDYMGQKLGKIFNYRVMENVRRYSPAEEAALLVGSMTNSFSPLGDPAKSVGQLIAPTALDPLVQISENKAWHGGKLMPDDFPGQPPSPDSQKFFSSTPRPYREVAAYMNALTGGTEITPGLVDVSPETLQLWVDTAGGGLARFMTGIIDTPTKDPSERELRDVPFLRRVMGAVGDRQTQTVFYDHLQEVERARDEMDAAYTLGLETEEGKKRLEFIRQKYPIAMHMIRQAYPNFGDNNTDDDRGRRAVMKALRESITPTDPTNAEPQGFQRSGRRRALTNDLRDARREIARLELRTGIPETERKEKIEAQRKIIRDLVIDFNKKWNEIEDSTYGERNSGKLLERLGPLLNGKSKKDATAALRGAGLQETASLIAELPSTPDRFAREFFLLEASKENS
jgi:GNAT superfamily N-acetyltransferase